MELIFRGASGWYRSAGWLTNNPHQTRCDRHNSTHGLDRAAMFTAQAEMKGEWPSTAVTTLCAGIPLHTTAWPQSYGLHIDTQTVNMRALNAAAVPQAGSLMLIKSKLSHSRLSVCVNKRPTYRGFGFYNVCRSVWGEKAIWVGPPKAGDRAIPFSWPLWVY